MKNYCKNPDYSCEPLGETICEQSPQFNELIKQNLDYLQQPEDTTTLWLATINKNGYPVQVQLTLTMDPDEFFDED